MTNEFQMVEGFKNTEVGVIPNDWEVKSGEELSVKITKGASPRWQGFSYQDNGILFVTSENVRDGWLDVSSPKYLPISFSEKQNNSQLKNGDLLINIVGASIGRACIYNLNLPANINQAVCLFRTNNEVNLTYLLHFFQSPQIIKKLLGSQVESARPNLSLTDIRNFKITFPKLNEQTAIATALNDADALINLLEQLLTKKRNIKTGAMQELLNPKEGWEVKKLGELIVLKNGYAFSSDFFSKSGPIVITPGNFKLEGGLFFNHRNTLRYSGNVTKEMQFQNGDLLIVMTDLTPSCNLLGKPGIISSNEVILHNQRIGKISVLNKLVNKSYLYWFFVSDIFSKRMKETATGSTVRHTSVGSINNTILAIPSLEEQTRIATILSDIDSEIHELEKKLEKYKMLKQGMMQSLLTGKIRLV